MIGYQKIKTNVEEFIAVAELNKKRQTQGLNDPALSLHAMFTGSPGTGKKKVARIISEILYENEIFSKVVFVEASRTNLIGNDIRETVLKTRKVLESALGGVLFIDEAYTLATEGSKDFGIEAVNKILNFMENHRKDIVIIFAGDAGEMEKFLNMNIDLKSRIPNVFAFPNYTVDELIQIGLDNLFKQNYQINESSYRRLVSNNYEYAYDESNRHWVQNINDQIIKRLALRTSNNNDKRITTIIDEDLEALMLTPPLSIDS